MPLQRNSSSPLSPGQHGRPLNRLSCQADGPSQRFTASLHKKCGLARTSRRHACLSLSGRPAGEISGLILLVLCHWLVVLFSSQPLLGAVSIGSRRELFVDGLLIERLTGTALRLHNPVEAETVLRFDMPWEGPFCGYPTVIADNGRLRLYYRGLPTAGKDGSSAEVTCIAESTDGVHWAKPCLGLCEVNGSRSNNVVLAHLPPFSHNFAPFVDARPGVPDSERYKALAGTSESGLCGFVSADGIRWRRYRESPLIMQGAFDSQNVAFWSESEHCYVAYFRTWTAGAFAGYRTISRAVSRDFAAWSEPVEMTFGDTPPEHLYTSQTHPYFHAPHIYVATPMRFVPGRKALTDDQAHALGVQPGYAGDTADTVFMVTRGGNQFTRLFLESFIRPGPDIGNWVSRAGMAALGIVPTGPSEMSIYKQMHYAQPTSCLVRYRLRTDGFISVNAPFSGGEMLTRPLTFAGNRLAINFETGAAGGLRVELQDAGGHPIEGFSLADAVEQIGDDIDRVVTWKRQSNLRRLAGREVRLRFVMKDADLYALQFRD